MVDIFQLHNSIGNRVIQRSIGNIYPPPSSGAGPIRGRPKIGQPGDAYEQDTDRVDHLAMRISDNAAVSPRLPSIMPSNSHFLQRQALEGVDEKVQPAPQDNEQASYNIGAAEKLTSVAESAPTRDASEPVDENDDQWIQPSRDHGSTPKVTRDLAREIHFLKGAGQPLEPSERAFLEPRFGVNFSNVRVHTDSRSERIAQSFNARAFTLGRDVVFGAGQYSPGSISSRRLLAHELTHVVQQHGGRQVAGNWTSRPGRLPGPLAQQQWLPRIQRKPQPEGHDETAKLMSELAAHAKKQEEINKKIKALRADMLAEEEEPEHKEEPLADEAESRSAFMDADPAKWNYKLLVRSLDLLYHAKPLMRVARSVVTQRGRRFIKLMLALRGKSTSNLLERLERLADFWRFGTRAVRKEPPSRGHRGRRKQPTKSKITRTEQSNMDVEALSQLADVVGFHIEVSRPRDIEAFKWLSARLGSVETRISTLATRLANFKIAHQVLVSYLGALRRLPGRFARRAAIEYQKLLVTTNVYEKLEIIKQRPGDKLGEPRHVKVEGAREKALAMVRELNKTVIGILADKLKKVAGIDIPGLLKWGSISTETRRMEGRQAFVHTRSGGKINRYGGYHDYGALDVNAAPNAKITLTFRKKIYLDEFPALSEKIPWQAPMAVKQLELTGGRVQPGQTHMTNPVRDRANKFLSGLAIKVSRSGAMVAVTVRGRTRRVYKTHEWTEVVGLHSNIIRFWSALKLKNTAAGKPQLGYRHDAQLAKWTEVLKRIFREIALKAGIPQADLKEESAQTYQIAGRDLRIARQIGRFASSPIGTSFIRERLGNLSAAAEEIRKIFDRRIRIGSKEIRLHTSNFVRVNLDYAGKDTKFVSEYGQYKATGMIDLNHMFKLSRKVQQGGSIDKNRPVLFVGWIGTTGGSSSPHLHIGANFAVTQKAATEVSGEQKIADGPASPLVFL